MSNDLKLEIAACAARWVVEEGLDYGQAKRKALHQLALPARTALPDKLQMEAAVREHIALYCADSQPQELLALRQLAAHWMAQLAAFRPHVCGAVWAGTATRQSDVLLQLFCDDPKSAEWSLIDRGLRYEVGSAPGAHGDMVDVLSLHLRCEPLDDHVGLHLLVHDRDDLRLAKRARPDGQALRGDLPALLRLMHDGGHV